MRCQTLNSTRKKTSNDHPNFHNSFYIGYYLGIAWVSLLDIIAVAKTVKLRRNMCQRLIEMIEHRCGCRIDSPAVSLNSMAVTIAASSSEHSKWARRRTERQERFSAHRIRDCRILKVYLEQSLEGISVTIGLIFEPWSMLGKQGFLLLLPRKQTSFLRAFGPF